MEHVFKFDFRDPCHPSHLSYRLKGYLLYRSGQGRQLVFHIETVMN